MMVTAVVLAGGSPATDKLLQELGAEAKSLLKIRNRELVRYSVDALLGSGRVDRLMFVGLAPDRLPGLVPAGVPVEFLPNQGGVALSVLAGLEKLADEKLALICSADIPMVTIAAVNDFLDQCARVEADAYYPIVERSVMEARYPGCGRSYRVLRDGYFCGGDLFLVSPRTALANRQAVINLTAARKSAFQIVRLFGPQMIVSYALHRLSIADAVKVANRAFNCRCEVIISNYPEIGMDVDKLYQFEMVRAMMEGAPGGAAG